MGNDNRLTCRTCAETVYMDRETDLDGPDTGADYWRVYCKCREELLALRERIPVQWSSYPEKEAVLDA